VDGANDAPVGTTHPENTQRWIKLAGPLGLSNTAQWQAAETAYVRYAAWHGQGMMIPQIHQWFAQQMHMGSMANLAAADQAMANNNPELAIQYLAKAHAFFPDGSYARFGVDGDGNIIGQQFDEKTGVPLGHPQIITREGVQGQIQSLYQPDQYLSQLQKYRMNNAEIAREANTAAAIKAGTYGGRGTGTTRGAGLTTEQGVNEWDKVGKDVDKDYRGEGTTPARYPDPATDSNTGQPLPNLTPKQIQAHQAWEQSAGVEHVLRAPLEMGGGGFDPDRAHEIAQGIVNNQLGFKPAVKNGERGVSIVDRNHPDGPSRGFIGEDMAKRLPASAGARAISPQQQGGGRQPVGAGLGTPMGFMAGGGNLAGEGQQQQQQQPGEEAPDNVRQQQALAMQRQELGLPAMGIGG